MKKITQKPYKMYCFITKTFEKAVPIFLFFSISANLAAAIPNMSSTPNLLDFSEKIMQSINIKIDEAKFRKIPVIATAYSSTPDQTDDSPFITAANTRVRDGVVAANFLDFHTKISIPDLYGDKVFIVEDRMNRRFNKANPPRIDVWLPNRSLAKNFGVKKVNIVILN